MEAQKRSFKSRIFLSYSAAFILFAGAIFFFQFNREKKYKADKLENTLDNISAFTHNYIESNNLIEKNSINKIDSLLTLLPITKERITVVDSLGKVLYDSEVADITTMENHLMRPEVQQSLTNNSGRSIRKSDTTKKSYYYYSRKYDAYFIRTAVLYDVEIKDFLKTERFFIFFLLILFAIMWFSLLQLTNRISHFISKLQYIAISAEVGEEIAVSPEFPDRELDVISKKIVSIYNKLTKAKYNLQVEKNKLFEHLNVLEEGIGFFSVNNELELSNNHYVQYLQLISDKKSKSFPDIFEIEELKPIIEFIENAKSLDSQENGELPKCLIVINKGEQFFQIEAMLFADKSYEVLISDISKLEKRKLIKKQLTGNIAHELKTPVTSIKGYIETILSSPSIPAEKQSHFLERALFQSDRLTNLLNDVSLLNNIEESGDLFEFNNINVADIINDVHENLQMSLEDNNVNFITNIPRTIPINGNESLLSSIFQNLIENSIKYAGENIEITINLYHTDERNYYFSYTDNGKGIPEEHQARIFERFYRVDKGRSREKGGTGLGLSIVKNAIQLHKGDISIHNRPEGGVEFLFSLAKK